LKLKDAPCGSPVQLKVTFWLKPFWGAIVTVLMTLLPADTLAGLNAVAVVEKLPSVASQACARLKPSTEPKPVTWS